MGKDVVDRCNSGGLLKAALGQGVDRVVDPAAERAEEEIADPFGPCEPTPAALINGLRRCQRADQQGRQRQARSVKRPRFRRNLHHRRRFRGQHVADNRRSRLEAAPFAQASARTADTPGHGRQDIECVPSTERTLLLVLVGLEEAEAEHINIGQAPLDLPRPVVCLCSRRHPTPNICTSPHNALQSLLSFMSVLASS